MVLLTNKMVTGHGASTVLKQQRNCFCAYLWRLNIHKTAVVFLLMLKLNWFLLGQIY